MKTIDQSVILIVDDKPVNILVLEHLLAAEDRVLMNATSGEEALKITLSNDIDLIILDVQMPGMDGFEVAQILKSNKRTKNIPIIFATAESKERQPIIKENDGGAVDYLLKPLDPDVVKMKVSVLLQIQLQKKQLIEKNLLLEKNALLIDHSADIIGIIDAPTFIIEEINNAFATILGYSREEAKGMPLTYFITQEDEVMLLRLGRDAKEDLSFETRCFCKDRRIKWLDWKVIVKDGKWFVNARDITAVKDTEKIRNYLVAVIKQSHDAIYIHDPEGKILSWNEGAERIYGYSETEALEMNIRNIMPEYKESEIGNTVDNILKGEHVKALETKRITKDGKLIDVLFSASVITDTNNNQKTIAITERDITDQKLARTRL